MTAGEAARAGLRRLFAESSTASDGQPGVVHLRGLREGPDQVHGVQTGDPPGVNFINNRSLCSGYFSSIFGLA